LVSNGYHDTGEEWAQKTTYRQDNIVTRDNVDILLYDDSTDALTDSDDIGAITTEPTTGNYTRQTETLDTSAFSLSVSGGDLRVTLNTSFDVTNTTETVDALAVVVDLQSDIVNAEGTQNEHLVISSLFSGGSRDLSGIDTLNLDERIDLD